MPNIVRQGSKKELDSIVEITSGLILIRYVHSFCNLASFLVAAFGHNSIAHCSAPTRIVL
jgi:hypothetical protein